MKKSNRSILSNCLFVILYSALVHTLHAGVGPTDGDPYLERRFDLPQGGRVVVKTSGGSIHVAGGSGPMVSVRVLVKSGLIGRSAAHKKVETDYEIRVVQKGDLIEASAKRRSWSLTGSSIQVSFEVKIPANVDCNMQTSGGSLSLNHAAGKTHTLKTSGGSIHLSDVAGDVHASTSGGSIHLTNIQGHVDAHTSGGSIRATEVRGGLEATTSGGNIHVQAHRGTLKASTSGGNVDAVVNKIGSSVHLRTSGGNVTADLPHGQDLDLDLRGNRVDADIEGVRFNGTRSKNKVVGTLQNGGIPVNLKTSGGSVRLAFH